MNIGSRGTFLNTGIPGTGLSFRQRLDAPPAETRRGSRSTYRALLREMRESERERERLEAAEQHALHEARIAALSGILAASNREPYRWNETWASRGDFQPSDFGPPPPAYSTALAKSLAKETLPLARWIVWTTVAVAAAMWFGGLTIRIVAMALGVGMALWVRAVIKLRARLADEYLRENEEAFVGDLELLRATHAREQGILREQWDEEERYRTRIRTAEARGDAEDLAEALEAELRNEEFPIPVVFDLEMPSVHEARIEVSLPEIADVPEERTQLTKTGKLSVKRMAQRDRTSIYADLCAGIALRLVHETFRVLPMVRTIEVFGTATGVDPVSGHDDEFVALYLNVNRDLIATLNLPGADPSSALAGLGGQLSCDRLGVLKAIPDAFGLRE